MKKKNTILVFKIDNHRFALYIKGVDTILAASHITPIINSPEFVLGVINYYGELVAVINLRKKFGLKSRELNVSDHFIIVNTPERKLAIVADDIEGVNAPKDQNTFDSKMVDKGIQFGTLVNDEQGLYFICDIETLLSVDETIELDSFFESLSESVEV